MSNGDEDPGEGAALGMAMGTGLGHGIGGRFSFVTQLSDAATERNGNGNSMVAFPNDMETFP